MGEKERAAEKQESASPLDFNWPLVAHSITALLFASVLAWAQLSQNAPRALRSDNGYFILMLWSMICFVSSTASIGRRSPFALCSISAFTMLLTRGSTAAFVSSCVLVVLGLAAGLVLCVKEPMNDDE